MKEQNYIQLSYQLINLTREDLEIINCISRNLPGLDLNAFSLSLLYLGFTFCTDKQKIFLNAPVQNELEELFCNPVRMKVDKNANQKLFNAIKKCPQGKIRRNYITAVLHAGIAVLIELSYLYKSYKAAENMADIYSINSFLLRFGLSACVETYTTFNKSNYIYDIEYLEKKYSSEITVHPTSIVKSTKAKPPTKQADIEKKTSNISSVKSTEGVDQQEEILEHSPTLEKNIRTMVQIDNVDQSLGIAEVKYVKDKHETTEISDIKPNKNNWLRNSFDKNLL